MIETLGASLARDRDRSIDDQPLHPLYGLGFPIGMHQIGDGLDGSGVAAFERVPLLGEATHDILPAGATGAYWADGVLVGSTLVASSCP